jgi:predicted dehydrogenase
MTRLKVGVVGAGIGQAHIDAYKALPDLYEVVALCDINAERREAVAEAAGIPRQSDKLEALFELDLDVIDICTPSALHFAQTTAALEAGMHAIVEKPVARSLAEVDALTATEARSARRVCPVFQYRYGHGLQKLQHLIAKGVAGAPSVATAETHWYRSGAYYDEVPWRGKWDSETGGCFTTHAIHIHDLLCQVLGPISSVHARASNRLNGNETEDMGVLSLEFESGALATSSVTLGSRQQISRLRFCFEHLVAESGLDPYNPSHEPWSFPNDDPDANTAIAAALEDFEPLPERFVGQFFRLHAALTDDAPLPVSLADSRRAIELLTAAYWSSRTGETVSLPIRGNHPFHSGWLETMKRDSANG